jgi:CheY-like chemotaxis protein
MQVLLQRQKGEFDINFIGLQIFRICCPAVFCSREESICLHDGDSRHARKLEEQVAERTQEVAIAKEKAELTQKASEVANQAKSTFISHMSHELRKAQRCHPDLLLIDSVMPMLDGFEPIHLNELLEKLRVHLHGEWEDEASGESQEPETPMDKEANSSVFLKDIPPKKNLTITSGHSIFNAAKY